MNEEQVVDVLAFDDGMSVDKAKDSKRTAKRLLSYLLKQRYKLLIVLIATVLACLFTLAAPLVIAELINTLLASITTHQFVDWQQMGRLTMWLTFLYLLSASFNYVQQYIMSSVSQTLSLTLRGELNQKMVKLPLSYFDQHQKGALMSRFTNDLERVADVLQNGLLQLMSAVVTIMAALVLMFWIEPLLMIIAVATILLGMIVAASIANKSQARYRRNQQALAELNGLIEEFFTGSQLIKAFNQQEYAIEKVKKANDELYEASRRAQLMTNAVTPLIRLLNQLGYVVMAVISAIFVLNGRLSLGLVQAFFQYVNQVSEPVTETAYILNTLQAAVASAERVFEVLDEAEEMPEAANSQQIDHAQGAVCFEHVSFGYPNGGKLMTDVNITVNAGEKVAIVGPTGAGKTTLVNLLMRFYELGSGRITIDNVDITQMSREYLHELLGMVLQDTWLFGGTIGDNIAYGRQNVSEQEIIAAAQAARADHFIRTLPDGYQTILNDETTNISQGQRQLLSIARTILADPLILILDEATSSVDTRTEQEIQQAMARLMENRTSFVIAHRLSTIIDADLILVVNEGAIVEQGTHEQLLAQKGFYAELYNSQFALASA